MQAIAAFDEVAHRQDERREFIRRSIESGSCLVAVEAGAAVGYAVLAKAFFGQWSVEMLYVSRTHRRRGVGTALMTAIEGRCIAEKLFVSTNQSNTSMQALLTSRGYQSSGVVENLDEGDPELIYLKRLAQGAL